MAALYIPDGIERVLGDFGLMLKWDKLFGSLAPLKAAVETRCRKTNMSVLLAPWLVIWITVAINGVAGGIAGVLAAAALPLLWLVFQPVVFEQITVPVVAALSLSLLLGADPRVVLPISYGAFGFMWLMGVFTLWFQKWYPAYWAGRQG